MDRRSDVDPGYFRRDGLVGCGRAVRRDAGIARRAQPRRSAVVRDHLFRARRQPCFDTRDRSGVIAKGSAAPRPRGPYLLGLVESRNGAHAVSDWRYDRIPPVQNAIGAHFTAIPTPRRGQLRMLMCDLIAVPSARGAVIFFWLFAGLFLTVRRHRSAAEPRSNVDGDARRDHMIRSAVLIIAALALAGPAASSQRASAQGAP